MNANQPWGYQQMMVVAAFRYCCGRRTYIVQECADWLIANWSDFSDNTKAAIKRDLDSEFRLDDEARRTNSEHKPLGYDCDRQQWDRVRSLWLDNSESF